MQAVMEAVMQAATQAAAAQAAAAQGLLALLQQWNFGLELPAGLPPRTADEITSAVLALRARAPRDHPAHAAVANYLALAPDAQCSLAGAFAAGLLDQVASISPYTAESIRLKIQHTDYTTIAPRPAHLRPLTVRQAIYGAWELATLVMPGEALSCLNDFWDELHTVQPCTWDGEDLKEMVARMLKLEPALANLV